jgi:two-component system C4-dicarboxylate transport sensor histidine kinase DctB
VIAKPAKRNLWSTLKWPSLLVSLCIFLSLIFYTVLLVDSSAKNGRSSKIYAQSLIASINQFEYLPALLSTDTLYINTLLSPNQDHFKANRKLNFTAKRAGADAVYIMDINGTVIATSNYNSDNSFLNKNYSFRPYFKNAIAERVRQFYYAKGATTGIPGFFISDPIIHKGQVIGVTVVKLNMDYWEENWRDAQDNIIAADENNVIILSSQDQWRYKSIGNLSPSVMKNIILQQQFSGKEHESIYERVIEFSFFKQINITFWLVDNDLYLTHNFLIPEVNWSIYYLVKHERLLLYTLAFLFILSTFIISVVLIRRERKHKLASIDKTRQLELIRQEELKTVMDNIHVGVTLFSEKGALVSINDHAKHLLFDGQLPYSEKTIYIDELISIDINHLQDLLLDDIASQTYHEAYSLKDGEKNIPVMFALSKVIAMDNTLYLMTFINIKRRKLAEDELVRINNSLEDMVEARTRELHKAQAKLIQKNKATALGNMAATIVHELSQPLSAMNSSIAAVNAKIENGDWTGAAESANRLNPLSKKMYNVIKLLKFFSYKDADTNNIINIVEVVEQSLDGFKDIFTEKGIDFSYTPPTLNTADAPIHVRGNPLKFELVLSNIVKNAVDASEKNTTPKINVIIESSTNINASSVTNGTVLITINDNGGGVDNSIMQKLFSPYFTTKEVGKGLGLGLSITYEIIQEYDGDISVSNTDEGACFTISLPIFDDSKDEKNNASSPIKNKRITNHG